MRKKTLLLIPVFAIAALCIAFLIYTEQYYRAEESALTALKSDESVIVTQKEYGWFFDGPSETDALIFYPGAKVEETAYAPLLHRLAEQGMDICLVRMPFRLAIFGANKADQAIAQHDYEHWYIGGHSLGGAMAASYAATHSSQLSGVFMLAAYPTKPLAENMKALIIYGSEDGVPVRRADIEKKYFAEGSCVIANDIYVLTWLEKTCFVYDKNTFERTGSFVNNRQGWGLTTDGNLLIMSDGSAQLYFVSPKTFTIVRSVTVRSGGKSVNFLNELEYIEGKIWANVYLKDEILIIDPATGEVEGVVDCRGLLPKERRTRRTDVLNGIAWNPATGELFITGKYWPAMYRIELEKKK